MSGKGGQNDASSFASVAQTILHRWRVERDVWVSAAEVASARAYLEQIGIRSEELRDGRFAVRSSASGAVDRSHLVLLSIKHLYRAHGPSSVPKAPRVDSPRAARGRAPASGE